MVRGVLFRLTAHLTLMAFVAATALPSAVAQPRGADTVSDQAASARPLADALTGSSKVDYDAGVVLFEDGDHAGALLKFQSAYQSSQDPRLLWNMAVCYKLLRRYAKMMPLIEDYLAKGGSLVSEEERAQARTVLDTLQPFVGRLEIQSNQPGASVYVDDELLGTTPLTAQRVDMGSRRIRVTKPEFVDWTSTVQVVGGAAALITANLQPVRHVGILHVDTDVGGDIRIDGRLVGRGQWQGELSSGTHKLEVRAPGMQVFIGDAKIVDKQTNTMRVNLRPLASSEAENKGTPLWLWIGGASLAAAGLGLGAYALFKPSDGGTAPPVSGTMEPGVVNLP